MPALTFVEPVFVLVPLSVRIEPVPSFSNEAVPTKIPEKVPELINNVPTALMALLVPPVNVPSVALLENCVVPEPLRLDRETVPLEAVKFKRPSLELAPSEIPALVKVKVPALTCVSPV